MAGEELGTVAQALATVVATVDSNLRVYPEWADLAVPPCVLVTGPVPGSEYEVAFGCDRMYALYELFVVVGMAAGVSLAQQQLRAYLGRRGDKSITAALYANPTLSGVVETLFVQPLGADGEIALNDVPCYGQVLPVRVVT